MRRKGRYISETFAYREDARRWATEAERSIDQGKAPKTTRIADKTTFGHLVDLHLDDLKAVKKPIGRTKGEALKLLKACLGRRKYAELDRKTVIEFGRLRASGGTGPVTLGMYIGYIKTVLGTRLRRP